jgi:hypothetical protein
MKESPLTHDELEDGFCFLVAAAYLPGLASITIFQGCVKRLADVWTR